MSKAFRAAISVLLLLLLCGCAPVSVSELYSLPQLPDEYLSLQALLSEELNSGSEYAAPLHGGNCQSVQQFDLDNNGQFEALAFFRSADGTLKICIYQYNSEDYTPVCTITGEGSSIGRIEYADMDGDGVTELIVSWQMDGGVSMLNVYSLRSWSGSVLLTANCSAFTVCSLEGPGTQLLTLRHDSSNQAYVDMYTLSSNEIHLSSAPLSRGFDAAARMTVGCLASGEKALFVEGSYIDNYTVTDVLIVSDEQIYNISAGPAGISPTTRSSPVYSEDINGDGITEIPVTRPLPALGDNSSYPAFDWYQFSASGQMDKVLSTFHCYDDGWYLELDALSSGELTIQRESAFSGRQTVISEVNGSEVTPLLTIYTYTGENRYDHARTGGKAILAEDGTAVYAVYLHSARLEAETISNAFHLISSEWNSSVL